MLANSIDLADRRAGAQQRPGHLLLLRERHPVGRRDPVRGAAARQQHQQEIVDIGLLRQLQTVVRALQSSRVGHRMAGFDHPDPPRRHAMAVAGGRDAGSRDGARPSRRDSAAPLARPSRPQPCRRPDRSPGLSARGADARQARCRGCAAATAASRSRGGGGVCRSSSGFMGFEMETCDAGYPSDSGKRKPPQRAAGVLA